MMHEKPKRAVTKTWFSSILQPFELLYLAIAVATFSHTQWSAAFLFEGLQPKDPVDLFVWNGKGALIAIAIDVGMLLTSRFLQKSLTRPNTTALVIAFIVAALGSFFTQLTYILYHTPAYVLSGAVSPYWQSVLQPIVDARVLILPAMLPLMATIYTMARITHVKEVEATTVEVVEEQVEQYHPSQPPITVSTVPNDVEKLPAKQALPQLSTGKLPIEEKLIDWEGLKFYDKTVERWRGPFMSKKSMVTQMRSLATRRSRRQSKE